MEESGIDMAFDLAAITADLEQREADLSGRRCDEKTTGIGFDQPTDFHENECDGDDDWEQTLSFLPTPMQDIMYYELKSRTPNTNRYVTRTRPLRRDYG